MHILISSIPFKAHMAITMGILLHMLQVLQAASQGLIG